MPCFFCGDSLPQMFDAEAIGVCRKRECLDKAISDVEAWGRFVAAKEQQIINHFREASQRGLPIYVHCYQREEEPNGVTEK